MFLVSYYCICPHLAIQDYFNSEKRPKLCRILAITLRSKCPALYCTAGLAMNPFAEVEAVVLAAPERYKDWGDKLAHLGQIRPIMV